MTATVENDSAPLYDYSDVEYVFKPHDNTLPAAREYIQSVWDRRDFITEMAQADVKKRGAGTVLGKAWGVMDPLFQAMIYWFLFNVIRGRGGDTNWLLMVVSGVFLFNLSSAGLNAGAKSIQRSKGLVLNSTFPLALLPLSTLYKAVLDFWPTVAVYVVIHLAFGGSVGVGIAVLPLLFVLQLSITIGLGLVFATLTIYIRDMSNMLEYIMRILFFVTPVIYPVERLSESAPAVVVGLLHFNPFFTLFSGYQAIITGGVPSFAMVAQSVFWAVVLPIIGFRVFVSRERGFALRL